MGKKTNPLKFFNDLIEGDRMKKLNNEFFDYDAGEAGEMSFDESLRTRSYLELTMPYGVPGELITEQFILDFFIPRLNLEVQRVKDAIHLFQLSKSNNIKEIGLRLEYLNSQLEQKFINTGEATALKAALKEIQEYLSHLYNASSSIYAIKHTISFGLKPRITEKQLLAVFTSLNEQLPEKFIHSDLQNLIIVLKSNNVKVEGAKIIFSCKTVTAAYILNKLTSYIKNFKWSTIEQSQSFYSKNSKLFNANNLSKSFSTSTDSATREIIDKCFAQLN
ncbi:MAG: DUF6617 family protein [Ferruginibacter sp.]